VYTAMSSGVMVICAVSTKVRVITLALNICIQTRRCILEKAVIEPQYKNR
jgi:hypothetical protein